MRKPSSVFGKKLPVESTILGSATAAKVEAMEQVDLTPTSVAAGGDAIARLADGRVVFVPGALPGEIVRCRLVSSKKDYARAEVVEVLSPSADRVAGHGSACGCTWSFVARPAQVALKESIVADALRRIGRMPS